MVFMSTWENNLNFLTLATNSKSPMSITHEICFLSSHQKDICLLYCMKVTLKLSYKIKPGMKTSYEAIYLLEFVLLRWPVLIHI